MGVGAHDLVDRLADRLAVPSGGPVALSERLEGSGTCRSVRAPKTRSASQPRAGNGEEIARWHVSELHSVRAERLAGWDTVDLLVGAIGPSRGGQRCSVAPGR